MLVTENKRVENGQGEATARLSLPALERSLFLRPIAHRGLHDPARGLVENTGPAFSAAIDRGYGIECDLQSAQDGTPMVFHDETLDRLVRGSGPLASYAPAALARLRYKEQDVGILSFAEFLQLVAGRVPVLVEVKSTRNGHRDEFLRRVAQFARQYDGPLALMSFDRTVVAALGELAPLLPRGLVVGGARPAYPLERWFGARERALVLSHLLPWAPARVAFLAIDVDLLPSGASSFARTLGLPVFTWTVRSEAQWQAVRRWADAPIFEGYVPQLRGYGGGASRG
jgi:glycerophosphoryl diester phosphodiesterase